MIDLLTNWIGPLLVGALATLKITAIAYAAGLVIGLLGASAKLRGHWTFRSFTTTYSTLLRSVPELVLIVLLYYAGPPLINGFLTELGLGTLRFSGLVTATTVLALVQGAYQTEIFRAAIQSIPTGHIEAADAYGMSAWLRLRRVVLPEMLPIALPSMYNMWLIVLKESALVSVVGAQELLFTAQQAAASTRAYFLFYAAAGALYLLMTMGSNIAFRSFEYRVNRARPAV